jgi:hypothetical protein
MAAAISLMRVDPRITSFSKRAEEVRLRRCFSIPIACDRQREEALLLPVMDSHLLVYAV